MEIYRQFGGRVRHWLLSLRGRKDYLETIWMAANGRNADGDFHISIYGQLAEGTQGFTFLAAKGDKQMYTHLIRNETVLNTSTCKVHCKNKCRHLVRQTGHTSSHSVVSVCLANKLYCVNILWILELHTLVLLL